MKNYLEYIKESKKEEKLNFLNGKTITIRGKIYGLVQKIRDMKMKISLERNNDSYLLFYHENTLYATKWSGSPWIEVLKIIDIKSPKIIFSKEDPYGEEDWDV